MSSHLCNWGPYGNIHVVYALVPCYRLTHSDNTLGYTLNTLRLPEISFYTAI